jgi:hypothetical protein
LSPTLKTLGEIGFLDAAKENKLKIVVLHVLGSSLASLDEIKPITESLAGSRYVAVTNRINETTFVVPGAIDIPKLDELATESVDKAGVPFTDYIGSTASMVLRGKVRHWLALVFTQFGEARVLV